jgi:hypothetical protein
MIKESDFNEKLFALIDSRIPTNITLLKHAIVERIADDGSPILVFVGEESPSQQSYINANPSYVPQVGDRVILVGQRGSTNDIIIGGWANA